VAYMNCDSTANAECIVHSAIKVEQTSC